MVDLDEHPVPVLPVPAAGQREVGVEEPLRVVRAPAEEEADDDGHCELWRQSLL